MLFKAETKFIFKGVWTDAGERMVKDDFIKFYGMYVDAFNAYIGEINDKWDALFGESSMNDKQMVIYNHFVAAEMVKYLIPVNLELESKRKPYRLGSNPDTALCRLYTNDITGRYVDFEINLLESIGD